MKIFEFKDDAAYEAASLARYRGRPGSIDDKSSIFRLVRDPRGSFFRRTSQKLIGVRDGGEILCQGALIKHQNFDALTLSFFGAAEGAGEAVRLMTERAEEYGRAAGAGRLIVSMDGHCNYALGFSCGEPAAPPMFGESRNPGYYNGYFEKSFRKIGFSSFWGWFDDIFKGSIRATERLEKRLDGVRTRLADFGRFREEIARYTDLSNRIFDGHWYYFPRAADEDFELFRAMKPLLSPWSLIFAEKDGRAIGYMLLYPDFNELTPPGGRVGLGTVLLYKVLRRPVYSVRIAEIAVLEPYRAAGVVFALFAEACRRIRGRHPGIRRAVSSWIMDENRASINVVTRLAPHLYGKWSAYEKNI